MTRSSTSRARRLEQLGLLSTAVAALAAAPHAAAATPNCQPWSAAAIYVAGNTATEAGKTYKANWWTQGNDPATNNGVTGTGMPWTLTTSCSASPTPAPAPAPTPCPHTRANARTDACTRATPAPSPAPAPGSSITTGTVNFHLLLGVSGYNTPQDSLTLTGDNYTDLIMSNLLAGVMYGHLLQRYTPGQQFNKDYLYGSVWASCCRRTSRREYYRRRSNLIDPSPTSRP